MTSTGSRGCDESLHLARGPTFEFHARSIGRTSETAEAVRGTFVNTRPGEPQDAGCGQFASGATASTTQANTGTATSPGSASAAAPLHSIATSSHHGHVSCTFGVKCWSGAANRDPLRTEGTTHPPPAGRLAARATPLGPTEDQGEKARASHPSVDAPHSSLLRLGMTRRARAPSDPAGHPRLSATAFFPLGGG